MTTNPLTDQVSAALAELFTGVNGPSHSAVSTAIAAAGLRQHDPGDRKNRSARILAVAAMAPDASHGRALLDQLLQALRSDRAFTKPTHGAAIERLRQALAVAGWSLSGNGLLSLASGVLIPTGGRASLDEQLERLHHNMGDPAAAIGTAKDLVESVCKFVLEERGLTLPGKTKFPELLSKAMNELGLNPKGVPSTTPGQAQIRAIQQSAKTITLQLNELRNLQGSGHGRTLPTGVSEADAIFVVREASHVMELMLRTLDAGEK